MFRRTMAAVVLAGGAATAQAQTTVTLYGIADGDFRVDHTAIGTLKSVGSGGEAASRFGLRGSEDLGGNLKVIVNLEQDVDLSDNSVAQGDVAPTTPSSPVSSAGGRIFGRRAIVGLSHPTWGELRIGRDTTPFYRAWIAADPWKQGTVGSGSNYALGSVSRFDNSVSYDFPTFGGFALETQYRAGESTSRSQATGPLDGGDALSAALTYRQGPLYAAAAYLQRRPSGTSNLALTKAANLSVTYDLGVVELHALGFYTNNFELNRYFSYGGGITVPIGAFRAIGIAARNDNRNSRQGTSHLDDANFFSIGGSYAFSKRTDVYAVAARFVNQAEAAFVITDFSNTGLYTTSNVPPGFNPWSMQVGVKHTF